MKLTRTHIIRSGLFILGIVAILSLIQWTLNYGVKNSNRYFTGKINRIMQHELDEEIVIFGASNAFIDFNPEIIAEITGMGTYNMGIDGTPFEQTQGLIREYASYCTKCKYVIFSESFVSLKPRVALLRPDNYFPYFSHPDLYHSFHQIDPELSWKVRYVPFYTFVAATNDYYKNAYYGWRNVLGRPTPVDYQLGFHPRNESWLPANEKQIKNNKPKEQEISMEIKAQFQSVISYLNEKGILAIIVNTPVQVQGQSFFTNYGQIKQELAGLAVGENHFWDYSTDTICQNKKWFYNFSHLNADGAAIFSKDIATKINELNPHPKESL